MNLKQIFRLDFIPNFVDFKISIHSFDALCVNKHTVRSYRVLFLLKEQRGGDEASSHVLLFTYYEHLFLWLKNPTTNWKKTIKIDFVCVILLLLCFLLHSVLWHYCTSIDTSSLFWIVQNELGVYAVVTVENNYNFLMLNNVVDLFCYAVLGKYFEICKN